MTVLPPEPERQRALRPRVDTGTRPDAFGTLRARFNAPPAPSYDRPAGPQTRGQYAATLLRSTRRAPEKEMIDIEAATGDVTKDTPATWRAFYASLDQVQRNQLDAAARDPQPSAAEERSGKDLPVGTELARALDESPTAVFSTAAGVERKIVGPHPFALARTEVRVGERGGPQAGLLRFANPPTPEELAAPEGERLRGPVPDTGDMSTTFGGSSGRGIFVLEKGRLHVTDTTRYAALFGSGTEAYHSSITGGQPVEAAGEIEIEGGRVVGISNLSGHYRPGPEHLLNTLNWLGGRGVDVSGIKVGVLGRTYDAVRFIKAGGDVTALEAPELKKRGVRLSRDPVTGRSLASVVLPSGDVLHNLSIASQQYILDQPDQPLSPDSLRAVRYDEEALRAEEARQRAQNPPGAAPAAPAARRPGDPLAERRATVASLLSGRRRTRVAPIPDRFRRQT